MFFGQTKFKKPFVALGLCLILVIQTTTFLYPEPANAQVGAPDVVAALTGKWQSDAVVQGILASSLGAVMNAFSYFMRKISYDTATYIASGGKGQGALAFNQGAGSYFKSVALDSAASAIEQFGSPFGLNLCHPPDIKLQVFLQVSIRKLYADPTQGGPTPSCAWNDFKKNWQEGADNLNNFSNNFGDVASHALASSLKVGQSDFGVAYDLLGKVDRLNTQAHDAAMASRLEGRGFKAVTNLISGNIVTPADLVAKETDTLTNHGQNQLTSQQVAGIYGAGLWQVIPSAASIFLNTLTNQLMQKVLGDGILPDASTAGGDSSAAGEGVTSEFSSAVNQNKSLAENAFNFLYTTVPSQELTVYPLMEEFNDCPENPGLNNCVADAALVKGVKQATTGKALTIREALDSKNNVLHPNWPLIPPTREVDNVIDKKSGTRCFQQKYCYSNIQKLRKARILPLGFEIAALKADPDKPEDWTLAKVVNGFEDCNPATGVADAQHPYCHLIDPNWIVRLPEPRCESKVYGPNLLSDNNATRRQECADVSTCIAEDGQGHCLGNYGYCLREKSTWRMPGSACPVQFNTCKTYSNANDSTNVSYLSRTLDYGQCNQQSVGCRAFSLAPKADGGWHNSAEPINFADETLAGRNHTIYFNDSIKNNKCSSEAEGCSALYRANDDGSQGNLIYLNKAPGSLFASCYLVDDQANPGKKVWPSSAADLQTIANRPEAATCQPLKEDTKFARACLKDEVGCEAYDPTDPKDKDNIVTGIIGGNACPAACVGYDTFKQEQPVNKGAFEPTVFPLYFIPNQATQCTADNDGCSEFTNIDAANAGGENLEWYTDLQYCERPNGKNEQTFYTWEGSINEGYVLRVQKLLPISTDATARYSAAYINALTFTPDVTADVAAAMKATLSVGPAYADDSKASLIDNYDKCNQDVYQANLQNPYGSAGATQVDCRAFYDDKGTPYYRILAKTISVSPSCHPLRKTESFQFTEPALAGNKPLCDAKGGNWDAAKNSCGLCYNGGIYNNGACVYWTTSNSESDKSCSASAVNCRSYTGKAFNNVYEIENIKFEPTDPTLDSALTDAKAGWSSGLIKPESINVGQYSLQVDTANLDYEFDANTLEKGKFYQLEFWSRGNPQNLDIKFVNKTDGATIGDAFTYNPLTGQTVQVPIGASWQQYTLGPLEFKGDGSKTILLRFTRTGVTGAPGGPYYLDNVRFTRVNDRIYKVKNSWKQPITLGDQIVQADAPLACDANPIDGLPGAALGCREYTDSFKNVTSTVGFEHLCRPQAVGCSAVYDSQNTLNTKDALGYNLWCAGKSESECAITIGTETLDKKCTVPVGETGCYVSSVTLSDTVMGVLKQNPPAGVMTKSTVIIPADTPSDAPFYLTYQAKFVGLCKQENLGCQKVALEEQVLPTTDSPGSFQFSEYTYKNNPDSYDQILCADKQVGCGEFKNGNTITYFKDPKTTGGKLCVYKDEVDLNGTKVSGWFKDDVGHCDKQTNLLCKQDSDCGTGNTCVNIGAEACYPNYQAAGGDYGIWSNKSINYNGSVGVCPSQYNQCTELIDLQDKTKTDDPGKSYYVIFNNALQTSAKGCNGQASLKDGCVLFNQTENPNKLYDSGATYAASASANPKYGPVDIKSNTVDQSKNDANVLLKVEHNRECSEWLSCKNLVSVQDGKEERKICYEYKSCKKLNGILECSDWSNSADFVTEPLTEDVYTGRDTSWYGEDYSGYSLFGKFQIDNIMYVALKDGSNAYAGYKLSDFAFGTQLDALGCKDSGSNPKQDWDVCGYGGAGRCYQHKCVVPLSGSFPKSATKPADIVAALAGQSCKAYPEADSPFSRAIAASSEKNNSIAPAKSNQPSRSDYKNKNPGYEGAHVCQESGDCSCAYQKITYKSELEPDYWPFNETNIPSGICSAGDKRGGSCVVDSDCGVGTCNTIKQAESHQGFQGICLEYDLSRPVSINGKKQFPCLTWLPVNAAVLGADPYANNPEAGYSPTIDAVTIDPVSQAPMYGGQVYCRNATANALGAYDKKNFVRIVDNSSSLCDTTDSAFACNQKVYPKLFNKSGDYIFDTTKFVGFAKTGDYVGAYDIGDAKVTPPFRTLIKRMNDPFNMGWLCYQEKQSGSKIEPVDYGCAFNVGFPVVDPGSPYNGEGAPKVSTDTYASKVYSMMQMWAWSGGMYGKGLALITGYPEITAEEADLKSCDKITDQTKKDDCINAAKDAASNSLKEKINAAMFGFDPGGSNINQINNPNAVVLFTSRLYYRDYLFTSLPVADQIKNSSKVQLYYEKRPLHDGNYQEFQGKMYSEPGTWVTNPFASFYKDNKPPLTDGITGLSFFESNNRVVKNAKKSLQKGYDLKGSAYESNFKLYEDEISKLHFGPLMTPPTLTTAKDMMASVATIDFDALRIQKSDKLTTPQNYEYELQKPSADKGSGVYAFRVHPTTGPSAGSYRYLVFAVSPNIATANGTEDELLEVFKDVLDQEAGDAPIGKDTQFKWQQDKQTERSSVIIAVRFNDHGEFKPDYKAAYNVRYRDGGPEIYDQEFADHDGATPYLAVTAELKPRCAEYGVVYNQKPNYGERTNKAWTDRVWKNNAIDYIGSKDVTGQGKVKRGTELAPFGSTNLTSGSFIGDQKLPGSDVSYSWYEARRKYVLSEPTYDGIMYDCSAEILEPYDAGKYTEGKMGIDEKALWGTGNNCGGGIYSFIKPTSITPPVPADKDYIFDYFAAYYKIVKNEKQNTNWNISIIWDSKKDVSGDTAISSQGISPQIYSLNTLTCYQSAVPKVDCTAGEANNVTVNRRNGVVADYNGDGVPDETSLVILSKDSLQATLQFFAFADHNRMPINRVMIDWGDDDIMNANTTGQYQNHKPFCTSDEGDNTFGGECAANKQLTCHQDSDCPIKDGKADKCNQSDAHFGNSPRACYPKYFEFFHGYSCNEVVKKIDAVSKLGYMVGFDEKCNPNDPNNDPKCLRPYLTDEERNQLKAQGYNSTNASRVCKFQPKVQVLDNWGWCNGSCGGGNGCYNGTEQKRCDADGNFKDSPHWTQFKGSIIVVPSK